MSVETWFGSTHLWSCSANQRSSGLPEPGLFVSSGNSLKQFIISRMCKHLINVVHFDCALQACAYPVHSLQPLHLQYRPVSHPSNHLG